MATTPIQLNVNMFNPDDVRWIHCNSCYKLYERNHFFYLLSCSNVMCRNCFKKGGRVPFCTICKRNVSFKIINEELEPKYLKLFKPEMNYNFYAEEFQYKHALSLAKKIIKTEKIAEENKSDMTKLIEYNEQYKKLRAVRKQKQELLKNVYTMKKQRLTTLTERDRLSEIGSSNVSKSRSVLSQSSLSFSIPSMIPSNKSTSGSLIRTESAKQFFQNRSSYNSGNKVPYRKGLDLSTTTKFNTYFKPPTKSTPIS